MFIYKLPPTYRLINKTDNWLVDMLCYITFILSEMLVGPKILPTELSK